MQRNSLWKQMMWTMETHDKGLEKKTLLIGQGKQVQIFRKKKCLVSGNEQTKRLYPWKQSKECEQREPYFSPQVRNVSSSMYADMSNKQHCILRAG